MKKYVWYVPWNAVYFASAFPDENLNRAMESLKSMRKQQPKKKFILIKMTAEEVQEDQ